MSNALRVGLPREAYDAIEAANFSTLKELEVSPMRYQLALKALREATDAMVFGKVVHTLVFEPQEYSVRVAVWRGGDRRSSAWKAFKAQNTGKDILTEEEAEEASALALAITRKLVNAKLVMVGGSGEPTLTWEDSGVLLKGRPDWAGPGCLIDLKTARNASPRLFGTECAQRLYHAQAAMYLDGYQAATGERPPFFIVAAEKGSRDVVVYRVSEAIIDAGRELYRGWLETLRACRASSSWPGYDGGAGSLPLVLPTWSVPLFEEVA